MSINQVNLLGRIGKIETKFLPNGNAVTNLSIATSERWKDKQTGQYEEKTEWTNCTAFGKQAEVIAQHFQKGGEIFISGKLQTRSWEDNGQKRYATDVLINTFSFTGGSRVDGQKNNQQQQGNQQRQNQQQSNNQQQSSPNNGMGGFDDLDDNVPF